MIRKLSIALICLTPLWVSAQKVKGKVYEDRNANAKYDIGEPVLNKVLISNGRDIVQTNQQGDYFVDAIEGLPIFVIKPSSYAPINNALNIPAFYLKVEQQSNKVITHDFGMQRVEETKDYSIALLGDMQVGIIDDIHHVEKLAVEELVVDKPTMVFPLGDLVFDELSLFKDLAHSLSLIGSPMYYVIGNHDLDFGVQDRVKNRAKSYEAVFGPSYYALVYDDELFLVLNNNYPIDDKAYIGEIDDNQKRFVKNALAAHKDKVSRVNVMMHIPVEFMQDKQDFIGLFADYEHVFVATGHTHTQYHRFFEREGQEPIHQLVAGAVCGAWWQGPHDIKGIPFAMMYDGTWKGYWRLNRTDGKHTLTYKVSGYDKDLQMSVFVPEVNQWDTLANALNDDYVYANVFAGNEHTEVEISYDGQLWLPMEYYLGVDPQFERLVLLQEAGRFKSLNVSGIVDAKRKSTHLWRTPLPKTLKKGSLIYVRATHPALGLDHTITRVYGN
ncbi:calcineurin-like phosphoesterase C-terminal domain-containing protein [Myroides pelagicus]|nr:calcineurin-like phosphoesterase C-terminal domain-containing protein [Myroides pelagicus]